MGTKKIEAGPRYVTTIEFVENLPAEESLFQDGEYQRLTESGKIENLKVKIEEYPDELKLLNELGNDDIKIRSWLVPGRTGIVATITRRINLRRLFLLKIDEIGESVIGVTGDTHVISRMTERTWFYDTNGIFTCIDVDASRSPVDFDEALLPKLWKTKDDQEGAQKLEELRVVLQSGKAKFQ
jgi:hypothetical protein